MVRKYGAREARKILDKKLSYTPKERLFGTLQALQESIAQVKDVPLRRQMERDIEAALSLEALICDVYNRAAAVRRARMLRTS